MSGAGGELGAQPVGEGYDLVPGHSAEATCVDPAGREDRRRSMAMASQPSYRVDDTDWAHENRKRPETAGSVGSCFRRSPGVFGLKRRSANQARPRCQGEGRGFESRRPLQNVLVRPPARRGLLHSRARRVHPLSRFCTL